MYKKIALATSLALILTLALVTVVHAKVTKYTFNDVDIDETIVEIEAGVKTTNKGDFSNCSYFSDDYQESLGYYQEAVFAGDTADEVLAFCVENFDERTQ
jgi:hypothetical protein